MEAGGIENPEHPFENRWSLGASGVLLAERELTTMSEQNKTLYERLGGCDAIAAVADDLVSRLNKDLALKPAHSRLRAVQSRPLLCWEGLGREMAPRLAQSARSRESRASECGRRLR